MSTISNCSGNVILNFRHSRELGLSALLVVKYPLPFPFIPTLANPNSPMHLISLVSLTSAGRRTKLITLLPHHDQVTSLSLSLGLLLSRLLDLVLEILLLQICFSPSFLSSQFFCPSLQIIKSKKKRMQIHVKRKKQIKKDKTKNR